MVVKKVSDFLSGVPMTIVGGIFLLISLALILMGIDLPIDPAWVAVIICGFPLVYLAISRVINNHGMSKISSAMLISIAMFAALIIGDLFAAGEVAFIMALGAILEDMTTERASKGLKKLIDLVPKQGRRIVDGTEEMVDVEQIVQGDIIRVLPGEAIPIDGEIVRGTTSVDQAVMTGESLPVDKGIGDEVFCGTINRFGSVDVTAVRVGEHSSLQQLIHLVQEAKDKKAPMQRIADVWATWLVPVALLIAIVAGFATGDIIRAVTVLVVFCPCALVLATPTAIMAAIGQATKYGVIIKSGDALERMGKVDTIAFDKTGTLTKGTLEVTDVYPLLDHLDEARVLGLTASAEAYSEHPLAKAITAYAEEQRVESVQADDFHMIPGRGIRVTVGGEPLLFGNLDFMEDQGIKVGGDTLARVSQLHGQGKAVVLAANRERPIGIIALSDTLRDASKGMVRELKATHTDVVLLTGDHAAAADFLASQVGIHDVRARLLPAQKVEEVQRLQAQGRFVCMIGDGVNDAPALKAAWVGVAMGTMGSDIAIDAADIALMGDDVSKIPYLKRLSNATVNTIKLSIGLSLLINFVAITASVMGYLTPTTGALVHNAGSILVVLIAALLYDRKFIDEEPDRVGEPEVRPSMAQA